MPVAKVNFMIALARVLHRHALGVTCSGGLGVLDQMHQSALWDVPMLVLHGAPSSPGKYIKARFHSFFFFVFLTMTQCGLPLATRGVVRSFFNFA